MTPQLQLTLKTLCFIPILMAVAVLNYTLDPVNIFSSLEGGAAQTLLAGHNITKFKLSTEGERLLQKQIIKGSDFRPEVVVFGSSRSMGLHGYLFEGRRFFNHSVSAGSLEDYMALYDLYRQSKKVPKTVVLDIDPWIFNKYNGMADWKVWSDNYRHLLNDHGSEAMKFRLAELIPEKVAELFSFSYFQRTIQQRKWDEILGKTKGESFVITEDRINDQQTILSDGSREMDRKSLTFRGIDSLQNAGYFFTRGTVNRYHSKFTQADPALKERFERFIALMKEDGVKVEFFLPPYHPYAYRTFMESHADIFNKVEGYLHKFADDSGCSVYGSYDPSKLNLSDEDFFDALHFKETAFKKIFHYAK